MNRESDIHTIVRSVVANIPHENTVVLGNMKPDQRLALRNLASARNFRIAESGKTSKTTRRNSMRKSRQTKRR